MTTINRGGLVALADATRAFLRVAAPGVVVPPIGWKERTKHINQGQGGGSRVCFVPGEFDGSTTPRSLKAGALGRVQRKTTLNPRELLSWQAVSTVCVWGVDTARLDDEEAQIAATLNLAEAVLQGMHNGVDPVTGESVGAAAIEWGETTWVKPPVERGFGLELLITFTHRSVFFDAPESQILAAVGAVTRNPPA